MMLKVRILLHLREMNGEEGHGRDSGMLINVLYFLIWIVITSVCLLLCKKKNSLSYRFVICALFCIYIKFNKTSIKKVNKSLRFFYLTSRISSSFMSLVISAFAFCTASSLAPGEKWKTIIRITLKIYSCRGEPPGIL